MASHESKVLVVNLDPINVGFYGIGQLPKYATDGSACFDIAACLNDGKGGPIDVVSYATDNKQVDIRVDGGKLTIQPYHRVLVPTGLVADIPAGYSIRLHSRSGTALKQGLVVANGEGIIDSDYVHPIYVILTNIGYAPVTISHGERIAQAEVVPVCRLPIVALAEPPAQKTTRQGGFGSTGKT